MSVTYTLYCHLLVVTKYSVRELIYHVLMVSDPESCGMGHIW